MGRRGIFNVKCFLRVDCVRIISLFTRRNRKMWNNNMLLRKGKMFFIRLGGEIKDVLGMMGWWWFVDGINETISKDGGKLKGQGLLYLINPKKLSRRKVFLRSEMWVGR